MTSEPARMSRVRKSRSPERTIPGLADFVGYSGILQELTPAERSKLDEDSLEIIARVVDDPIMCEMFTSLYPDIDTPKSIFVDKRKPLEEWNPRDFVVYICTTLQNKYRRRVSPFSWKSDCVKVSGFLRETRLAASGYVEMIDWLVENVCSETFVPEVGYFASFSAYNRWKAQVPSKSLKGKFSPFMQSRHEYIRSTEAELKHLAEDDAKRLGIADMSGKDIEEEVTRLLARLNE